MRDASPSLPSVTTVTFPSSPARLGDGGSPINHNLVNLLKQAADEETRRNSITCVAAGKRAAAQLAWLQLTQWGRGGNELARDWPRGGVELGGGLLRAPG